MIRLVSGGRTYGSGRDRNALSARRISPIPTRVSGVTTEATTSGPLEGVKLDTETLELDFLNACDWDTTTTKPSKAKLESLGLKEVAMALHG